MGPDSESHWLGRDPRPRLSQQAGIFISLVFLRLITRRTRAYHSFHLGSRDSMSTDVMQAPPSSAIRRKPIHTYRSPVATGSNVANTISTLSQHLASTSTSTSKTKGVASNIIVRTDFMARKKYPMAPPLPLYHPLGKLALSLPPLEPSSFGHSPRVNIDDSESGRRSSGRSRRPAAKVRDAEEDEGPRRPMAISNVSAIAAVAAREIKEKATPRKRRGGGAKRKRKDLDDGDATYPATKRTRNPRGAAQQIAEDSPNEEVVPLPDVTVPAEGEGQGERRSTRSWRKRRDSSASDGTSVSASAPGTRGGSKVDNGDGLLEGKEEGEVSEEVP